MKFTVGANFVDFTTLKLKRGTADYDRQVKGAAAPVHINGYTSSMAASSVIKL